MLKHKVLAILLFFLFISNLDSYASYFYSCHLQQAIQKMEKKSGCETMKQLTESRDSGNVSYIYLHVPNLPNNYLEYVFKGKALNQKIRAIPIIFQWNFELLNPKKHYNHTYEVSSHYKENILKDHPEIQESECLFMVLGSQYRFSVNSGEGDIFIGVYYNFNNAFEDKKFNPSRYVYAPPSHHQVDLISIFDGSLYPKNRFLVRRHFIFSRGQSYELSITPTSKENLNSSKFTKGTPPLKGFDISIVEMPDDTKFDFDGKDDVGKTLEDVEKEFYYKPENYKLSENKIPAIAPVKNFDSVYSRPLIEEKKDDVVPKTKENSKKGNPIPVKNTVEGSNKKSKGKGSKK
jgi:hypothetical protein